MATRRSYSLQDPRTREQSVVELLDEWPWDRGGVTIGGYAVMAYGPPRYSRDVDLVVPASAGSFFQVWLREKGFSKRKPLRENPQNFTGPVSRYIGGDVEVDLLEGAVRDRDARVDIPETWISRDARPLRLTTMNRTTLREIKVARPEALWALKLQSGRDIDLSDLFAISPEPFDQDEVADLFASFASDSLLGKLRKVSSRLENQKLYRDSLTRRSLGGPNLPSNRAQWSSFISRVRAIIDKSESR